MRIVWRKLYVDDHIGNFYLHAQEKEEDNLMAAFQSGYVAPPAPTFAYGK